MNEGGKFIFSLRKLIEKITKELDRGWKINDPEGWNLGGFLPK